MIVHEIPGIHSVYTKLIQIIFSLSQTCLAVLDWTFSVLFFQEQQQEQQQEQHD